MKKDFESFIARHRQKIPDNGFSGKVRDRIGRFEERRIPGSVRVALCAVLALLFTGALWLCGWGLSDPGMPVGSLVILLSSGCVAASSLWLICDIA